LEIDRSSSRCSLLDLDRLPDGRRVLVGCDNRVERNASAGSPDSSSDSSTRPVERHVYDYTEHFDIHHQALERSDVDSLGGPDDSGRRHLGHVDLLP
jgi:hypothetical protein